MIAHNYSVKTVWTGNSGNGTSAYRSYERSHTISIANKPALFCSADPTFRGDKTKHNPEELLLAALSGCHMMSFLHVCVQNEIVVTAYEDTAVVEMVVNEDGSGRFTSVTLRPIVTVESEEMLPKLDALHKEANSLCFTFCQIPVVYKIATNQYMEIVSTDGTSKKIDALTVDFTTSQQIFGRTGTIEKIIVNVLQSELK